MRVSQYPFNLELLEGRVVKYIPTNNLFPSRLYEISKAYKNAVALISPVTGELVNSNYKYLDLLEIME